MSQSGSMKESPGSSSPGKNSATPVKKRGASRSSAVVRKSERLKNNSPDASSTKQKTGAVEEAQSTPSPLRRSERGKNQSSSISSEMSEKRSSMSKAKGKNEKSEAGNSEEVGTKRRRLDAKRFKALFLQQKNISGSPKPSEKPKLSGKLSQSNHRATEAEANRSTTVTEAEDQHHIVNNRSAYKLRKNLDNFFDNHDLLDGKTLEVQIKEVFNAEEEGPSESNAVNDFPASRCEANNAELDSSKRMRLEIQSKDVSIVPGKERHTERDAEIRASVQQECLFSPSRDNRGSTLPVESDRLEASDESHIKSQAAAATSKENSMRVDDIEKNIHCRDADDLNHMDVIREADPAIGSDSAYFSRSRNEANDLSGRYASSPRKHRFAEYWVPARLSNLQLEQYCSALLANSISLCSSSKNDPVGALRNLLITLRKACNHPFLVDPSLSSSLLKDLKVTEYLDAGIKASGKLQLLDIMLMEMRRRGLRVLILYEASIYARDAIGDILDDFLRQRYGLDSYEHFDGGCSVPSKKQAALNKFNDKESKRFVFLLETRARLSSIKLSSVDAVIIYNSDWYPVNDIKALQKIALESQHDPINVFRLFLPLTVEENAMILSKHNVTIDNNMHNINQSNRDRLLTRGATDLFDELERFHHDADHASTTISSVDCSLLQDIAQELMIILLENNRQIGDGLSICLRVQRSGGDHCKFQLVPDELKTQLNEERRPRDFWSKLLEGRNPRWKYVSNSNQRNRKRVHYNESGDAHSNKTEEVKRRRKIVNDSTSVAENQKLVTSVNGSVLDAEHLLQSSQPSNRTALHKTALESGNMLEESKNLSDTDTVKPELQQLCELLNLSDDVKNMAERFLEYVLENHHVTREPVSLFHAFQLSVCWIAASLRKKGINGKDSLALAQQHLSFCCSEDDADYMYLKMVLFKELFTKNALNDMTNGQENNSSRVFDAEKLMVKIIRQIKKKCRERMSILIQNQHLEIEELQKSSDVEKARLEQLHKVEVVLVRSIHAHNPSMAADKLKVLEDQYTKKLEDHRNNLVVRLKSLENKHSAQIDEENELTSTWKEDIVKEQVKVLRKLPHRDSEDSKRKCITDEQLGVLDGHKDCPLLENQEVQNSQPGLLAGRVGGCQSVILDEPSALPPVASEAVNNSAIVDPVVSTSDKVLLEHSSRVDAETGQDPCGQVANSVDLTHDTEAAESSSVDVLPLDMCNSAVTDSPSAGKTLERSIASRQLSSSADLIPGNGSSNPMPRDVPQSLSSDNTVAIRPETEAPSTDPIVPLPLSTASPDKEMNKSSLVPSLQTDNHLHPSQLNAEKPATEGQPGLPSSAMTPISEQHDSDTQHDQSLLHTAIDQSDVEPSAAEAAHRLPLVDSSYSQLHSSLPLLEERPSGGNGSSPNADAPNRLPPSQLNAEKPATEGQPGLPSPAITPRSEQYDSDTQHDQSLLHTVIGHSDVEPSAAEVAHRLPLVDSSSSQLHSSLPLLEEQPGNGSSPNADAPNHLPPSQLNAEKPATEGQPGLPSSAITPISEQYDSDTHHDRSLLHTSIDHSDVEPSAAEAAHQLPLVNSSSSQLHSGLPLFEEQPSGGNGSSPNADAPNPSLMPSVMRSQSTSIPGPRATDVMSDFAISLRPGTTVATTVSSHMPMFSCLDPLQSELERIQKAADHSIKIYEEMKQQLHSECDREIAEIVAQISKKYETKNLELDAAFKCKKDELDAYHDKVYMNRILAEVYRNKCMELKVSVPPGMAQENIQHQPRLPIFNPGASSAGRSSGNFQAAHNVHSASSAAPDARNLRSTQNPVNPGSPSVVASHNSFRPSGPSAAASRNILRPGSSSAAASQWQPWPNASHNPMRLSGASPMAALARSTTPASPAVPATVSRPVQVVNSSSALFSSSSARPVHSTSTAPPTVNLHSVSGIRAPPPHLRSRVSQPVALNTTSSAFHPSSSSQPQYCNVSLSAPTTVGQHSSFHRAPAPQSANAAISTQGLTMGTISGSFHRAPAPQSTNAAISTQGLTIGTSALRMLSDIEKQASNGNAPHSQTFKPSSGPSKTTRPHDGSINNSPFTSGSATSQVVCLSDEE